MSLLAPINRFAWSGSDPDFAEFVTLLERFERYHAYLEADCIPEGDPATRLDRSCQRQRQLQLAVAMGEPNAQEALNQFNMRKEMYYGIWDEYVSLAKQLAEHRYQVRHYKRQVFNSDGTPNFDAQKRAVREMLISKTLMEL